MQQTSKAKKFRNAFVLSCALSLAIASSGCSQSGNRTERPGNETKVQDEYQVTFNVFRDASWLVGYPDDGGPGKKVFLDAAAKVGIKNIDFKVSISGGQEYTTKLNVLSASGNLPDYFSVDIPTMIKYADERLIMPLDDLLAEHAPNLTKQQSKQEVEALRYKGKIWAVVPGYRPEPFNGPSVGGYNIRTDWLDGVGLEMPTTLDQLHEVLKAFTFNDPDKNSKNDTYGLSTDKTDVLFEIIFGAYGIQPEFWAERNGKLQKGFTLAETKDALKLLRDWYEEGIIDPDFPTNERKHVDEKVVGSKVGVWKGGALSVNPEDPRFAALLKANPKGVIGFLTPPAGPKGLRGIREIAPGGDLRAISAKTKDPVRLMKLIDWSSDYRENGGAYLATFGKEGEHFTLDKEKNLIKQKVSYSDLYKLGLSNPVRFVSIVDRRWVTSEKAREAIKVSNEDVTKNAYWLPTPSMFDYPDLETKLWPEYALKIILGELPVDAWDEFVKKYYEQGGKQIEGEVNAAWKKEKASK